MVTSPVRVKLTRNIPNAMFDHAENVITFIPYKSTSSKQAKELQLAEVRSHAAKRGHKERKLRRHTQNNEHAFLEVRDGILSPHQQTYCHLVSNFRPYSLHDTPRSVDWFFGNIGVSCRPVTNIDVAALNWYLDQSLELAIDVSLFSDQKQSFIRPLMAPLSETIVQRAVSNLPLLDSLVASNIFLMARAHSYNGVLVAIGYRYIQEAVRNLRSWISSAGPLQPIVLSTVVYLCHATFGTGDFDAVETHLRLLVAWASHLDPEQPLHNRILLATDGCNLRYALESGRPMIASKPTNDRMFKASSPRSSSQPNSTAHGASTSTIINFLGHTKKQSHVGIYEAIASEILSTALLLLIHKYTTTQDEIYTFANDPSTSLFALMDSIRKCHDCLRKLCATWYETQHRHHQQQHHHHHHLPNPSPSLSNNTTKTTNPHTLDEPLLLAMQIHLTLPLGYVLAPALPALAQRLHTSLALHSKSYLPNQTVPTSCTSETVLRNSLLPLLLFLLATGLTAAPEQSPTSTWFSTQALATMQNLRITNQAQMRAMLRPFVSAAMPDEDRFFGVAIGLVGLLKLVV